MGRSILDSEYYSSLKGLEQYKYCEFEKILGPLRLSIFKHNNYPVSLVYEYHLGRLSHSKRVGAHNNLLGYEFQAYEAERLASKGQANVILEKDIGDTKVDILANILRPIPYYYVNLDGSTCIIYLIGMHNFENKACTNMPRKAAEQVQKALNFFKGSTGNHVLVLKDSLVEPERNEKVHESGGNVLKSDITKAEIEQRIKKIGDRVRAMQ